MKNKSNETNEKIAIMMKWIAEKNMNGLSYAFGNIDDNLKNFITSTREYKEMIISNRKQQLNQDFE